MDIFDYAIQMEIDGEKYYRETAQKIDSEVNNLVSENYKKTYKLLKDNLDTLNKLAKALLEKETLNGNEIDEIVQKRKSKRQQRKTPGKKKVESRGKKS